MKKLVSWLFCALVFLSSFSVPAFAEQGNLPVADPVSMRIPYENGYLLFQMDGTITGSEGLSGDLTVPDTLNGVTVSAIADHAFLGEGGTVTLPDSVRKIGDAAFEWSARVRVSPENPWFFTDEEGCLYSKDLRVMYHYNGASERSTFTVPEGVEVLRSDVFLNLLNLKKVILPSTLRELGCNSLFELGLHVVLRSNIEVVGEFVFHHMPSEASLTVSSGVTYLPTELLAQFSGEVLIEAGNPRYEAQDGVVYDTVAREAVFCKRTAVSAVVREGTLSIGPKAFERCRSLKSITLPEGLRSIGENAFDECYHLTCVVLPDSVEVLEKEALYGCSGLEKINLPKNLQRIGDNAWGFVDFTALKLPSGLEEIGTPLKDPDGPVTNSAIFWGSYRTVKVPDSVGFIGSGAFVSTETLSVLLPDREMDIAWDAFQSSKFDSFKDCRGVIFYGEEGSFAQQYAQKYDYIFRLGKPEDYPAGYQDTYPGTPYTDIFDCSFGTRLDICEAYQMGLLVGVSENRFAPREKLSRAMFVTALYRIAGEPAPQGEPEFTDVDAHAYYGKAVAWAQENGVVAGVGSGRMNPHRAITYQEAAAILHRWYARQKGKSEREFLEEFPAEDWWSEQTAREYCVAPWAAKAYQRLSVWGVLFADEAASPQSPVTRAAAAGMLNSYSKALKDQPPDRKKFWFT